jgi:hypothetical protein
MSVTTAVPTVFIAIPAQDMMWTVAVGSLFNLRKPPGSGIAFETGVSSIAGKRKALAESFIAGPWSHLFFLDSDMDPPRDTVLRLLSHRLPIVSGLAFTRVPPYAPGAGFFLPDGVGLQCLSGELGGPSPLRRVDWTGFGCVLITREALLAVPRPWFLHADDNHPGRREDVHFCRQAAKANLPIHCDTGLSVGHIGATCIDVHFVAAWQETSAAQAMIRSAVAG